MQCQKFGEMKYGQWFKECRSNPRIFVKIQNILPSGISVLHISKVAENAYYKDGTLMAEKDELISGHFNAIDSCGIPARCPDWLEFELIDSPFKENENEHGK